MENCKHTVPKLIVYINKIQRNKQAISFSGILSKKLQTILITMIVQSKVERISSFIQFTTLIAFSKRKNLSIKRIIGNKQTISHGLI